MNHISELRYILNVSLHWNNSSALHLVEPSSEPIYARFLSGKKCIFRRLASLNLLSDIF